MYRILRHIILSIIVSSWIVSLTAQGVYSVEKMPFSSGIYDEYAPVIYKDGMIFVSNRRTDFFFTFNNEDQNAPWSIFFVRKLNEEEWSEPELFSMELKTNANDGPITINRNGDIIYFNQNYNASNKLGNVRQRDRVGIFSAELVNNRWTNIQPFPHNNERYNLMHPSLSRNGQLLFFSSNMQGGEGGYDLYVSRREGNTWSEPLNLGPVVNTRRNEVVPVIHPNGRLFFSSNGYRGLGGYDLFYTENINGQWIPPEHLDAPINSRRNDIGLITDDDFKSGYFASNRDRRSASIYEFVYSAPEFEICEPQQENDYCFIFYEEGTMDIDTTNFMYQWKIEGKRYRSEEVEYCFSGPGLYEVQLDVVDMLTDSVMFNQAFYELLIEDIEQVVITAPDTVFVNNVIHFDGYKTFLKNFEIDRYYWDMGNLRRLSDTAFNHIYYKPGVYSVRCGVTSKARNPENIQKSCSTKRIVVLPKPEGAIRDDE